MLFVCCISISVDTHIVHLLWNDHAQRCRQKVVQAHAEGASERKFNCAKARNCMKNIRIIKSVNLKIHSGCVLYKICSLEFAFPGRDLETLLKAITRLNLQVMLLLLLLLLLLLSLLFIFSKTARDTNREIP